MFNTDLKKPDTLAEKWAWEMTFDFEYYPEVLSHLDKVVDNGGERAYNIYHNYIVIYDNRRLFNEWKENDKSHAIMNWLKPKT